jgi:recombination protein RecA
MAKTIKAQAHAADVCAAIKKALPKLARSAADGSQSEVREVIQTGIEVLDLHVLGCGGLPIGRMGEVFADEGAGKTSLGFTFLAAAQRAGGVGVLLETEKTLQVERAAVFGVVVEDLILMEPKTMEQTLDALHATLDVIPAGAGPNVLVWDSLAATELRGQDGAVFDKDKGGQGFVGKKARLMSQALPVLGRIARDRRAAIVIINQVREKIGVVFGDPTTTQGGNATKHHMTWRLQLWRGAAVKEGAEAIGIQSTVKAVKNKVARPFRKAKLRLLFEDGWDSAWSLMDLGKDLGVLPDGAHRSTENLAAVREYLVALRTGPTAQ